MRRVGVHTSIAGGIDRAIRRAAELGCTTLQIFSHNPRSWLLSDRKSGEGERFRISLKDSGIWPVYIHSSYLINLASRDPLLASKSADMVASELDIADMIGADYVILHTGSATGDDPREARKRASYALADVAGRKKWHAGILLENTAGERGDITSSIADLSEIISMVPEGLIAGICLDTCHAFAAGYDVSRVKGIERIAGEIRDHMGMDAVKILHVNDCKGKLGSGVDRHEHIGRGGIGLRGFALFLNRYFTHPPVILETPKISEHDDARNLKTIKKMIMRGLSGIYDSRKMQKTP